MDTLDLVGVGVHGKLLTDINRSRTVYPSVVSGGLTLCPFDTAFAYWSRDCCISISEGSVLRVQLVPFHPFYSWMI
jgi:hypothetical protein